MPKASRLFVVLSLIAALVSGCAVNRATATVSPSTDLSALKTMYIQENPKDQSAYSLIADKLRSKGVTVTTGTEASPTGVDAVVTYVDKWMWDITMYMIELTVVIREPKTDFPLATGNSFHTSLTRLSPKEMVNEVIDNIYKESK